jgi:hypothetical protein
LELWLKLGLKLGWLPLRMRLFRDGGVLARTGVGLGGGVELAAAAAGRALRLLGDLLGEGDALAERAHAYGPPLGVVLRVRLRLGRRMRMRLRLGLGLGLELRLQLGGALRLLRDLRLGLDQELGLGLRL